MTFEVDYKENENRIYVKLIGFLKPEETEAFSKKMKMLVSNVAPDFSVLADLREYKITTGHDFLTDVMATINRNEKLAKLAVVRPKSAVGTMQINRLSKNSGIAHLEKRKEFPSLAEALSWLSSS